MKHRILILLAFISSLMSYGQHVLINSSSALYDMNQGGNLCNYIDAGLFCNPKNQSNFLFSIAIHKDTLYFISTDNGLYRMKLGDISTCELLTVFPVNGPLPDMNSLGIDKDGILYTADGFTKEFYRYDPYRRVATFLGHLNVLPGGDFIFYKKKLLLAALDGSIYEVNPSNPSACTVYIPSSGVPFFGLISIPYDCKQNKYYGVQPLRDSNVLYELDLENRKVVGRTCTVPFRGLDGASNVDDGNTLGVSIDSIIIKPACGLQTSSDVNVLAYTASDGNLTYILDDSISQSSGRFDNLSVGIHKLKVTNQQGCSSDTTFTIYRGLSDSVSIGMINALSCTSSDGSIAVSAHTGYLPLSFSIDGGGNSFDSVFQNLSGGFHMLHISDAEGCMKDTTVLLHYNNVPHFFTSVNIQPTVCSSKTGSISIIPSSGFDSTAVTTSLNSTSMQHQLFYSGLDSGKYILSLVSGNDCRYDTIVNVGLLRNPSPFDN